MKKLNTTRRLTKFVEIVKQLNFNYDIYFSTYAVHCIENWYPSRHNSTYTFQIKLTLNSKYNNKNQNDNEVNTFSSM